MNLINKIGGMNEALVALYYRALGATHVAKPEGASGFVYYKIAINGTLLVEAQARRKRKPKSPTIKSLMQMHEWEYMHNEFKIPDDALSLEALHLEVSNQLPTMMDMGNCVRPLSNPLGQTERTDK